MKLFKIKSRINKANGQLNFSLPKKKLPKSIKDMILIGKNPTFKIRIEGVS